MHTATVLVLNAGSSSLKATVLQCDPGASGGCERLWSEQRPWPRAVDRCLADWLPAALEPWRGRLDLVAHRVVHGGSHLSAPQPLTETVRNEIATVNQLAPLHNAKALAVIEWMDSWLQSWQPDLGQWVCCDTAFHSTLPASASTYALPEAWRAQGLRRYGFHGLNHQHVAETVAAILQDEGRSVQELADLRLISAHLGAGCSLCAVLGGRSIATTMGFTPLEGLVMATRSGSIDPGLLLHVMEHQGLGPAAVADTLNHHSGLLGLSGLSADLRVLRQAEATGHPGATLAIDVFTQRLLEGIGAMAAALQGVDVIALTGGIGQNDEVLAHTLYSQLQWLQPLRLLQIPADEEGQIARQCVAAATVPSG